MNRSELIDQIAKQRNLTRRHAERAVNIIFDAITDALIHDERIEIRGFGSFTTKYYEGYTGRNPKSGEPVEVAPKRLPFFRAGKEIRARINDSAA